MFRAVAEMAVRALTSSGEAKRPTVPGRSGEAMLEPTSLDASDDLLPPRWSARSLLLAWSVPVVLGFPITLLSLRSTGQQVPLWKTVVLVAATWYVWVAMTPLVVRLAERRRLERPLKVRLV